MSDSPTLLLREPVVTGDGKLEGYRFTSTGAPDLKALATVAQPPEAGAAARRLALIDVPADALLGLRVPPGATAAVAIVAGPQAASLGERLRAAGLRLAAALEHDARPPLPGLEFVTVRADALADAAVQARAKAAAPTPLIVSAQTRVDQHDRATAIGARYHGGTWQRHVAPSAVRPATPAQSVLIDLINLAQAEAPVPKIEQALKRDGTISFRLLRYINSAGFGLAVEVQSIRHAISMLGYRNLQRWMSLLLASAGNNPASPLLTREAAVRGRVAELLAHGMFDASERENVFLAGTFSLLPSILQIPVEKLVDQVAVTEAVSEALIDRSGLYGPLLALAEALDSGDADTATRQCEQLALDPVQVNTSHLAAIAWADALGV